MTTLTSFDGTVLHYEVAGEGEPVVLLHGFTSSTSGNWQQPGIWGAILETGKKLIGLDARGHGRSDKPTEPAAYENQAMVRDVGALFDHLQLASADVVGYSMGAMTAVRFAATDQRVRRLVLGGIGGDPASWTAPEVRRERRERNDRILAGLHSAPDQISDPLAQRGRRLMELRGNNLEAMAAFLQADRPFGGDVDVAAITAPTLVVCGADDFDPRPLAAAIPQGEWKVLPGDHEGVVREPELAKAIATFVAADSRITTPTSA